MSKFIVKGLIFFSLFLLFNFFVFQFAKTHYYEEYSTLPNEKESVFLMADSHGLCMSKYAVKYGFFNFSAGSDSYLDIKRKIVFLLANDYKVKRIFLSVDDHMLSPYRETANNIDRSSYYNTLSDYENWFSYFKDKYVGYYLPVFESTIRSLSRNFIITQLNSKFFSDRNKIVKKNIWCEKSESIRIRNSRERYLTQFAEIKRSEKLTNILFDIINICKKNNIELIGVKFPLSSNYLSFVKNKNYGADELFYNQSLKVIDGKQLFIQKDCLFSNQDHLNIVGGKLFSDFVFRLN